MYQIWRSLRQPFYIVECTSPIEHQWECYDCNKAGCKQCGKDHVCCSNVFSNKSCVLEEQIDGSYTCTVTGYSVPCIRTSNKEYFEHCVFTRDSVSEPFRDYDRIRENISFIIHDFLFNSKMKRCKIKENHKKIQKLQITTVKNLKAFKLENEQKVPNLIEVIAQTLAVSNVHYSCCATKELADQCVQHITKCVVDLDMGNLIMNKSYIVVGLLYLMKSGLCFNNVYWLPKLDMLAYCLPHENYIEKMLGYSIKIICETENEIKLQLRNRSHLL